MTLDEKALEGHVQRIRKGGAEKYHRKNAEDGKLFCRERVALLFDEGADFVEDGLLVNARR